jgi:hypothetical protein
MSRRVFSSQWYRVILHLDYFNRRDFQARRADLTCSRLKTVFNETMLEANRWFLTKFEKVLLINRIGGVDK